MLSSKDRHGHADDAKGIQDLDTWYVFLNVSFPDAVDDVLVAVSVAMSHLCT